MRSEESLSVSRGHINERSDGWRASRWRKRRKEAREDYGEHRYSDPRQLRQGCPMRCVGPDHWNLELDFLIASLVLSKEKLDFWRFLLCRAIMLKLLRWQLIQPAFPSPNNKLHPQPTSGCACVSAQGCCPLLPGGTFQGAPGVFTSFPNVAQILSNQLSN